MAGLAPELEAWIEQEMARWHFSGPMVLSECVAFAANMELDKETGRVWKRPERTAHVLHMKEGRRKRA